MIIVPTAIKSALPKEVTAYKIKPVRERLPPRQDHPGSENNRSCQTCHNSTVIGSPPPGAFTVTWDSAPTGQNFSTMGDSALCNAAKAGVGGHDAQDHLKNDSLILWAIVGGNLPRHTGEPRPRRNLSPAFPEGIHGWRRAVDTWVRYGMPCP